jgi:hypothetical protein
MALGGVLSLKVANLAWIARGKVGFAPSASKADTDPDFPIDKTSIILLLAGNLGFKSYLEICSTVSGNFYHRIRGTGLLDTRRLLYRCKWYQRDGLPIDYRSPGDDIAEALADLRRDGFVPDICLVDSWHEYATSLRDIEAAYALLPLGGVLVVHDCLPPSLDMALPKQSLGCWCGYSYRAYIDFVSHTPGLEHFTIDSDYGCGVVIKGGRSTSATARLLEALLPAPRPVLGPRMLAQWKTSADDPGASFALLHAHKHDLLNLVSSEQFCEAIEQVET